MKFLMEINRFTKRPSPNYRNVECLPAPTSHYHITKGLFTVALFTLYILSSYQGKSARKTEGKNVQFEERQNASDQSKDVGIIRWGIHKAMIIIAKGSDG